MIYADFFLGLSPTDWDRPSRRGPDEWNVHTTVAHLCGLTGAGLASVQATLRGEPYEFAGLDDCNSGSKSGAATCDGRAGRTRKPLATG